MADPNRVNMTQITNSLWMIEDWIRSVREVLMMNEDTVFELPEGSLIQALDDPGGGIKLIRGCPPPDTDDPCDEEEDPKGGKGQGKGKGKGLTKSKKKKTK